MDRYLGPVHPVRGIMFPWLFATAALVLLCSTARANEPERRLELGVAFRFMPTGWFDWSRHAPSSLRAYPALGGAAFVDYRVHRYFSVGFMPELAFNVIPKLATDYPASKMVAVSLRLKAQYPEWSFAVPYVLLAPGYSWLIGDRDLSEEGDARGFLLAAYGGLRVPITARHAVIAEAGYAHGFQEDGNRAYAPSYLVVTLGWQASL